MLREMIDAFLPSRAATVQTLGHPSAGVVGWFDAATNTAGAPVTESTALTYSAVWCATRIISETLATLPCMLYRRTSDDSRERATDDPRYFLVHDEPHPQIAPVTFFETLTGDVVNCGNAYARIVRDQMGTPIRLEPRMSIRVDVDGDTIVYTDTRDNSTIPAPQMLHVLGLGGDGITGWSVVKHAANSIGGGIAAENRANSQFKNGAMPGGALSIPTRLDKPAREAFRRDWEDIHGGSENANRIAILHGGLEFKPFTMTNDDAQFLQSRKFSIEEIARWYRVPLHMLAHLENSSVRANIEQAAIEFVVYSMTPWLVRWQQQLNRKLLRRDERPGMYFEFFLDALLRGDSASRFAAYATGRQWGWLSVNDIRRAENMNSIGGGDIYLQPVNMVEAGTVPNQIASDMQANLHASLSEIQMQAASIKQDIATGHNSLADIMAQGSEQLSASLKTLREDREEIKHDLDRIGKTTQARGWTLDAEFDLQRGFAAVRESALDVFREALRMAVRVEKAEAVKAARRQQEHGESFVRWLDCGYITADAIFDRTAKAVQCWESVSGQPRNLQWQHEWIAASKQQLLNAADGDPVKFVERVQATVDGWEQRVNQATPA